MGKASRGKWERRLAATAKEVHLLPEQKGKPPDMGLFVGIVFGMASIFLFVLQANGVVEVNWKISILCYSVVAITCTWPCCNHAIPHKSAITRFIAGAFVFGVFGIIGAWATVKQYHRERVSITSEEARQQMNELNDVFAGRDESELRSYFGFPKMLTTNISINKQRRLNYQKYSKDLDPNTYLNGHQAQYDSEYALKRLHRSNGPFFVTTDINVVSFIVLPETYTSARLHFLNMRTPQYCLFP
jgi:hypothetical protein